MTTLTIHRPLETNAITLPEPRVAFNIRFAGQSRAQARIAPMLRVLQFRNILSALKAAPESVVSRSSAS